MKYAIIVTILLATPFAAGAATTQWLSPDFAVYTVPAGTYSSPRIAEAPDCRSAIAATLCLVDPAIDGEPGGNRPCLEGGQTYAKYFEDLYDRFPASLQKMFCRLKKIYIEKDFIGSAYGGVVREGDQHSGAIVGGVLGIRQALLDQPSTLDEWASWKEQLHFGADPHHVSTLPGLPLVHSNMAGGQAGMLYFLVAHEFGHAFDFTNELNDGGSWRSLSWKDADVPLDQNEFPLRKDLCFYFCDGKFISADRQDELYQSLRKTNFLSAYATRYAAEDFADTFAYYWATTDRNLTYHVITASGFDYDAAERLRSDPLMQSKRQYIETFLKSDFRYPGDPAGPR